MTSPAPALYDDLRPFGLFLSDSYRGGVYYRWPSSAALGTAHVTAWSLASVPGEDGTDRQVIVESLARTYRTYLVAHPGETASDFEARQHLAVYVNLVAPVVDAYVGAVTGHVQRDLGTLGTYLGNLNGRGRRWAQVVREAAQWAAVYGWCATVVDAPRANPARSRAEEEALGVGPRCIVVQPTAVAWIDVDSDGEVVEFAYVDQPLVARDVTASRQPVRLWIWNREGWEVREGEISTTQALGAQRASLQPALGPDGQPLRGPLPASLAGRVPVTFCYYREDTSSRWPLGISLVGDAALTCRQIYNELSNVESIHRHTAFPFLAVPVAQRGSPGLEPEVEMKLGPNAPLPYPAEGNPPQWVEHQHQSTKEIRDHVLFLFQLALRTTGLEVAADASAQVQSGEALRIRSRDFESRAADFAGNVQAWEAETLDLLARLVGDRSERALTYPRRYVLPDDQEGLARAVLLYQTLADSLGAEGIAAAVQQALSSALYLSDEQVAAVMAEVREKLAPAPEPGAKDPDVQAKDEKEALNGAQVTAMKEIVTDVAAGALPRDAGVAMLLAAFPLSPAQAEACMGSAGRGFVPAAAAPAPSPFPPRSPEPPPEGPPEPPDREDREEA